jgi:hypothetical protein
LALDGIQQHGGKGIWRMCWLRPLLGTGTQSRYASRGFIGSALGPTFGLLDTVTDVTAGVLNGDAGDRAA